MLIYLQIPDPRSAGFNVKAYIDRMTATEQHFIWIQKCKEKEILIILEAQIQFQSILTLTGPLWHFKTYWIKAK